jgi:hypothetical protein
MEADVEAVIRQHLIAEDDLKFVNNCKSTEKYGADDSMIILIICVCNRALKYVNEVMT